MITVPMSTQDQDSLKTLKTLGGTALLAVLVASGAGLILLIATPDAGSTGEAVLGFTAAAAGLGVAVLAISAAIYAQAKGLWKYVPTWLRVIAWAFIAYGIAMTIWNLIDQLD